MYFQNLGRVELSDIPEQVRWRGGAHVRAWTAAHNKGLSSYWVGKRDYAMDGSKYRERTEDFKWGPWKPLPPVKRPGGMREALKSILQPGRTPRRPRGPQPRPAPKPKPPTPGARPAPSAPITPGRAPAPAPAATPGRPGALPLPILVGGVAIAGLGLWFLARRRS